MSAKMWVADMVEDVIKDDKYRYESVTKNTLEGGLNVMRKSFFLHESVAVGVELEKNPEAQAELEKLSTDAAKDGVSVVAIEKSSGKVVGVAFNKIQIKGGQESLYFENFKNNCKQPSAKGLLQFMIDVDASVNLFHHCQVDCLMEIMFLSVLPEYWRKGIATKLWEVSIKLAQCLKGGNNVKVPLDDETLELDPKPDLVTAILTSFISQKLGRKYSFEKAVEINYENFTFEGSTFASRIGPESPVTTLEFLRL